MCEWWGHTDVILFYMYVLHVLYVSLVIMDLFKICWADLKNMWLLWDLYHVTTTILTKGKEARSDDLTATFAIDDHRHLD